MKEGLGSGFGGWFFGIKRKEEEKGLGSGYPIWE